MRPAAYWQNLLKASNPGMTPSQVCCLLGGSGKPIFTPVVSVNLSSTNGAVILNWPNDSAANSFQIWKKVNSGSYVLYATASASSTSYIDTAALSSGDINYYQVVAVSVSAISNLSNEVAISNGGVSVTFNNSPSFTSLYYPTLIMELDSLTVAQNGYLTNISLPLLQMVVGSILISPRGNLAPTLPITIDIHSLQMASSLLIQSHPMFTSLDLSGLVNPGTQLNTYGSTALSHVTFSPNFRFPLGVNVDMRNCALDATTINTILRLLVLSGPSLAVYRNAQLQGGTNAAPTGQGVIDAATLAADSCSLVTN